MTSEQIEKAKEHGAIAVLSLLENASLGQRLVIARVMREDAFLRHLVKRAAGYMMSERRSEAAFWMLLSIRLGGEVADQDYVDSLTRMRHEEKRPVAPSPCVMKSRNIIARTARLESAMELLAEQMGYLANRSIRLERAGCKDADLMQQLESMRREASDERSKLSLDDEVHTQAIIEKYGRYRVIKLRTAASSPSSSGPIDDPTMEALPAVECPVCGEHEVYFVPDQEGPCHSGQFRNHWQEGYWCDACGTDLEEDK